MEFYRYMVLPVLLAVIFIAVCGGAAFAEAQGPAAPAEPAGPTEPAGQASPSPWAEEQVQKAIAEGIAPENMRSDYGQAATRAEFAALAVAAFEMAQGEIAGRSAFIDSYDINVEKAAFAGIVIGVGGGRFDPDSALTREMAAVMLSNLADALGEPFPGRQQMQPPGRQQMQPPVQQPAFADNGDISPWAAEGVSGARAAGIMLGIGDGLFAPQQPYTREQSIVTIIRMIDYINEMASIGGDGDGDGDDNGDGADGAPGGDAVFNAQYVRAYLSYVGLDQPIVAELSSAEELAQFYEILMGMLPDTGLHSETDWARASEDAFEKYNDEYFADSYLVLVFLEEPSGSNRHSVDSIDEAGNIAITRLVPQIGTTDMAQWLIIIELDKSFRPAQFTAKITTKRR